MADQTPIVLEDYYAPWDRWFENRIYPSPEGLTIFFHEITEQKRAQLALQASEARFRALVEHAPDGGRRKDGSLFPAEAHARVFLDGNVVAIVRDISERKRMETLLREREHFLQEVLDTEPGTAARGARAAR